VKAQPGHQRTARSVVFVLVALSFTWASCGSPPAGTSPGPQGGSSWWELFDYGEADVGRFVMGFMDDDIPTADRVGTRTYSVAAGEPVPVTYHGLSSMADPVHLRITLLVDLQQVPFTLDGEADLLHDVVLETQVIRDIPIVIPPLAEGPHDLIWLAFMSPDDHSPDKESRHSRTDALADRRTLLAGGKREWRALDVERLVAFDEPEDFAEDYPWTAFVTDRADAMALWCEEEVARGERLDYYIFTGYEPWLSPMDAGANTFAILVFLDYKLVPLVAEDNRLVRFFSLDADTPGTRIDAGLVAPEEAGPHELCALRVDNPAHTVDELSCEECSHLAWFPQVDRRTLITVR
jgi:hypothetical protein